MALSLELTDITFICRFFLNILSFCFNLFVLIFHLCFDVHLSVRNSFTTYLQWHKYIGDLNLLILHVTYSGKTFNLVKPAIKHMQINRWETLKSFIMATGPLKSKVHCSQSDKKIAVILWNTIYIYEHQFVGIGNT